MNIRYFKLRFSMLVLIALIFSSCSSNLKVIQSEFELEKIDNKNFNIGNLGNGRVLIYNGADILHEATGRINIWINGKPLGQLRLKEYVIVNLEKGLYDFKIQHIDVVNMRSNHKVEIAEDTKIIRAEPTVFSNKLTITNNPPKRFENYKNIALR